ncbi:hypothetical protein CFC21_056026, partial [Triticum aestivum]
MLRLDPGEYDEETMGGAVKEEDDSDEEGEEDDFLVAGDEPRPPEQQGRRRGRGREEKERTKARERRRRAVTGRILAGLRRHGGFGLRSRADVNEVVAALARHAGWVVLPDGTTFPSSSHPQLGVVSVKGEVAEADELVAQLRVLKAAGVDGVMVDCWWGNVEAHRPQEYNWAGYKRLFHIIRDLKLKLQVVMSFHECGGNVGDDVSIPLPEWVIEIGKSNPDIYFTDREGRRNTECLSWGIDKERVLQGRTAVEVYFDFMRSFRVEFDEYFEDGIISEIEVGLGA